MPKYTSDNDKVVRGTFRKARRARTPAVQPVTENLPPPDTLTPKAQAIWQELTPAVQSRLTEADLPAFGCLCEAIADTRELRQLVATTGGWVYESLADNGKSTLLKANPAGRMLLDANRLLLAWLTHFGMTPASRGKVSLPEATKDDPAEKYFST